MEYSTEEEQIARLKNWWSLYGNYIFYGLLVIFGCAYAYKTWLDRQDAILEKSSSLYTRAFEAFSDGNDADFQAISGQLLSDYPDSVYTNFVRMLLAKDLLNNNRYSEAENYLLQVIEKTKQKTLQDIATLRLARIYFSEGKFEEAKSTAVKLYKTDFEFFAHELNGDLYLHNNDYQNAKEEYKIALEKQRSKFPRANSIIENKLQFISKYIPKD